MSTVVRSSLCSVVVGALVVLAAHAQNNTVLFQDDFNVSGLSTSAWSVGSNFIGPRTQLGNTPTFGTDGDGTKYATLIFDTYNASYPGQYFKGTEILTRQSFDVNQGIIFEARVRCRKVMSGQVCSAFTYFYEDPLTDEIDFEFLTKQPTNTILATTWNDWDYRPDDYSNPLYYSSRQVTNNFNRAAWNTLEIVWLPGYIEWYVNGQCVRATTNAVPDSAMNFRLNFWAPGSGWTDAYNANLKPASKSRSNVRYYYDVDYARVTQLGP
ncbi:MAG: glycoside hydrolase family 16 protein [Lentisphaerota bacterium]